MALYSHEGPVFDICWSKDGSKLFSSGADKSARMFDMNTGQNSVVAMHQSPISCVRWIDAPTGGFLVTGSWDKTVKYWNLKSDAPMSTFTLPERCYTMDAVYPLLVVGTAERHICIVNLLSPGTIARQIISPLKWQTRSVACFPGADGFAVVSIEGRVAIQYIEEKNTSLNYSFRCHRHEMSPTQKDQTLVFAVNDIIFHQQQGTFVTAGADGVINFWDKDSKTRLRTFDPAPGPIISTAFNRSGTILAYAVSYDWGKGYMGMTLNHPNKVLFHACSDDEVKKRSRK